MFKAIIGFLLVFQALAAAAAAPRIDYSDQTTWTGSCNVAGNYQSPVDIPCDQFITSCPPNKNYQIYWQNPLVTFGNSTYEDLKTYFTDNSWLRFSNETNDYTYKSWQFHFHQPSEHTVNGVSYPLEVHLVHRGPLDFAVVGLFFEADDSLEYDIFDSASVSAKTPAQRLFPFAFTNKPAYHYRGSLTTPPCLEAVNWFVQVEPIKIRREHLEELVREVGEGHPNNRLPQRLGDRNVYLVGQGC